MDYLIADHVTPRTGPALKNERLIPFVEMINEPVHYPEVVSVRLNYQAER